MNHYFGKKIVPEEINGKPLKVSLEKDAWPNGIAVDTRQKRIYWAEGNRSLIKSASLEGNLDVQIFSTSINHPYSLSLLGMCFL